MFTVPSKVTLWVLGGTLAGLAIITSIPAVAAAFAFQPPAIRQSLLAFVVGVGTVILLDAGKIALRKLIR